MDDGCASAKRKSGHLTSARRGKGKGDDDDAGGKKKRGRPRKGEGVVTNPVRVIFCFVLCDARGAGVVEEKEFSGC